MEAARLATYYSSIRALNNARRSRPKGCAVSTMFIGRNFNLFELLGLLRTIKIVSTSGQLPSGSLSSRNFMTSWLSRSIVLVSLCVVVLGVA